MSQPELRNECRRVVDTKLRLLDAVMRQREEKPRVQADAVSETGRRRGR